MGALDPFKVAAWWTGMALGIPMLATELAAEIWRPAPKPTPVPAEPAAGDWDGMSDATFRSQAPGVLGDLAALRLRAELTQKPAEAMRRDVAEIQTHFTTDGLDEVVKAAKRARKKKAA